MENAAKKGNLTIVAPSVEFEVTCTYFTDASDISDWAKSSVAACVNNNVVSGNNGKITAKQNITRAETAKIVRNLLQKSDLMNK